MKRTKYLFRISNILTTLSIMLSWGPLCVYAVMALNAAKTVSDKVTLTSLLTIGVIMSLIAVVNKHTLRCKTWIFLIAIWVCLDNMLGCVLVIAITQCLDEIIVAPIAKAYRSKYVINKEIDRRG